MSRQTSGAGLSATGASNPPPSGPVGERAATRYDPTRAPHRSMNRHTLAALESARAHYARVAARHKAGQTGDAELKLAWRAVVRAEEAAKEGT